MVSERGSVHNGIVTNGTGCADGERSISIDMEGTVILNVCVWSDDNRRTVSTNNCIEPDTGPLVNGYIANNNCAWSDKDALGYFWRDSFVG
jgi:hypothetical protein